MATFEEGRIAPLVHILTELLARLEEEDLLSAGVIPWSAPVPTFGDLTTATIATLGINPSNREFMDEAGVELGDERRRLPTLRSLRLKRWAHATKSHKIAIIRACCEYFSRNPYDIWFKRLDQIISGSGATYYESLLQSGPETRACHLDLIPYSTLTKWTSLLPAQRASLLRLSGNALGELVKWSPVRLIVVNGSAVVENLQRLAAAQFEKTIIEDWTLPRRDGPGVAGIAFRGKVTQIGGVSLGRTVSVLGFNHNIQSSFGVTGTVQRSIRHWLQLNSSEVLT